MKFKFSKLGNRISIKTVKENRIKVTYVQTYVAKKILDNIKKYNWEFEIENEVKGLLL